VPEVNLFIEFIRNFMEDGVEIVGIGLESGGNDGNNRVFILFQSK
jgi:hypothetical protein